MVRGIELSARNQLKGKVKKVTERLKLAPGDAVTVIIKSTEVMLGK
jgi:molybdopterin-binding protein